MVTWFYLENKVWDIYRDHPVESGKIDKAMKYHEESHQQAIHSSLPIVSPYIGVHLFQMKTKSMEYDVLS